MRRGLAVAAAGAVVVTTLSACGAGPAPAETATSAFALVVGDCTRGDDEHYLDTVQIVDCDEPHVFEVFASVRIDGELYPGEAAIEGSADPRCVEQFAAFIGLPRSDSELAYDLVYPTEQSWQAGDREVLCRVVELDERGEPRSRRGSLEGSAR